MSKPNVENLLPGVPLVESPLFDRIVPELHWDDETMRIARSLREDGYAIFKFPEPDFRSLSRRVIEAVAPAYQDPVRIQDAWKFSEDVRRIATNDYVVDLLSKLYGRRALPFQTLNFRVGSQQAYHTDSVHFNSIPERFMVGIWVALEDIDDDNGPLIYYPGSHRLPVYLTEHVGVPAAELPNPYTYYDRFQRVWDALVETYDLKPTIFKPKQGEALIWAANLLHGGAPQNDPDRSRHSQVTHYFFEDCLYYTPLMSNPLESKMYVREIEPLNAEVTY